MEKFLFLWMDILKFIKNMCLCFCFISTIFSAHVLAQESEQLSERLLKIGYTISLKGDALINGRGEYVVHTEIIGQIALPLVQQNRDGRIEAGAAERWQIENKNRRIRFFLRENLRWSDGSQVTSDHFILGMKRLLNEGAEVGSILKGIVGWQEFVDGTDLSKLGISAPIKSELVIDLIDTNAVDFRTFSSQLLVAISPSDVARNKKAGSDKSPLKLSYGPYQIKSLEREKVVLEKNPYFVSDNGKMYDKIIYLGQEKKGNIESYTAGDIDILMGPMGKQVRWIQDNFVDESVKIGSPRIYGLLRNLELSSKLTNPILDALSSSINREEFSKSTFGRTGNPLYGVVPVGIGGYPGLHKIDNIETEPQNQYLKAVTALQDAGYSSENPLKLKMMVCTTVPGYVEIAQYLKIKWKSVGVELELVEEPDFFKAVESLKDSGSHFVIGSYVPDSADVFQYLRVLNHYAGLANIAVDDRYIKLLDLARYGLYYQNFNDYVIDTDRFITRNHYFIPLLSNSPIALVKPMISGLDKAMRFSMPQISVSDLEWANIGK